MENVRQGNTLVVTEVRSPATTRIQFVAQGFDSSKKAIDKRGVGDTPERAKDHLVSELRNELRQLRQSKEEILNRIDRLNDFLDRYATSA